MSGRPMVRLATAWLARFTLATVDGHSMTPTLHHGDRILVRRRSRYRVGDIIVFRVAEPASSTGPSWRVKRVTAVAGQAIPPEWAGWDLPPTVPPGQLAVAGDGRRTEDSRHLGFIPLDRVAGRRCRIRLPRATVDQRSGAAETR